MSDLSGKTWFVTGAGSGFGRMIAEEVLARGGNVALTTRTPAVLADLADRYPDRALPLAVDLASEGAIAEAIRTAETRFGGLDAVVNNAGYGFLGAMEEASDAELRDQMEINFFSVASVIRHALPGMRAAGAGTIVNVTSIAAVRGAAAGGCYSASKFALEGLSESLAAEVEPFGIRVLVVEPGPFRTDFFGGSMKVPATRIEAYQTATELRDQAKGYHGHQSGDPERAARIIVDAVAQGHPALRLVLGGYALRYLRDGLQARIEELDASRAIAKLADFHEI